MIRSFGVGHSVRLRASLLAGVAVALISSNPVWAAEAEEDGAKTSQGEIVVTATRREGSVKDAPLAISATTGDSLRGANISSFQDLTRIDPSLTVNNQGTGQNQFIIRGILSDIGQTTGLYLDEAALSGVTGVSNGGDGTPGLRMHDIARVEVLKGPQGTLFGAGALAGTIRVVTNKPDFDRIAAGVNASAASIDSGNWLEQVDGYVNVPLGDKVAVRAVGWGEFGGGFIDQHSGLTHSTLRENVNDRTVGGGRLQVTFRPIEDFTINLSATEQTIKVDGIQSATVGRGPFFGPYDSNTETAEPYKEKMQLYIVDAEMNLGFGKVSAIWSYGKSKKLFTADTTPLGLFYVPILNNSICANPPAFLAAGCPLQNRALGFAYNTDYSDYTAELRFSSSFEGPFQIVAGGYYEKDKSDNRRSTLVADNATGNVACLSLIECEAAGLRKNIIYAQRIRQDIDQMAVYAQGDFDITEQLRATAGIRYYHANILRITDEYQNLNTGFFGVVDTPILGTPNRAKESSPSYNFSLLYKATPDISLFARAASGFRIGGVNDSAGIAQQAGVTVPAGYGSDNLWSYEFGAKANLLDRKLYVELTGYQMDWTGMQNSARTPTTSFPYVVNAGKVRIRGAELLLNYNSDRVALSFGGTYTDARLAEDLPPEVILAKVFGYKGDRVPRVPQWLIAGSAEYKMPFGKAEGFLHANFSYRSSSKYSWNDKNEYHATIPSAFLLGASAGVRLNKMELAVFAENLTNRVNTYGYSQTFSNQISYVGQPRTIGVRLRYDL